MSPGPKSCKGKGQDRRGQRTEDGCTLLVTVAAVAVAAAAAVVVVVVVVVVAATVQTVAQLAGAF